MSENINSENDKKVQISTKVDPSIFTAVTELASIEDRSVSNMVERLLKTNPQVAERLLTSEPAAA